MEAKDLRGMIENFGEITLHNHTDDLVYSIFYGAWPAGLSRRTEHLRNIIRQ